MIHVNIKGFTEDVSLFASEHEVNEQDFVNVIEELVNNTKSENNEVLENISTDVRTHPITGETLIREESVQ